MKKFRGVIIAAVAAALVIGLSFLFSSGGAGNNDAEKVTTDKAVSLIDGGTIKEAIVKEATILDGTGSVELKDKDDKSYTTMYPSSYASDITKKLIEKGVEVTTKAPERNTLMSAFIGLAPMLLLIGLAMFLMAKQGMFKGGRFDSQVASGEIPEVTFDDVAGAPEAVHELKEIVEFLTNGEKYVKMGAKPPKGALLVGPPGTGKTLIAKATAHESGLPFYSISGSDFVEMFAGLGPRRVRKLFKKARETGGIIFIDEIDAAGQKRGSMGNGGDSSERENVIAAMLTEMDGFESRDNVLVIAATNRPETLDEALLRPGRLDRQIQMPLPDIKGREQILAVHTKGKPMDPSIDWNQIASHTAGMSGAELAFMVNEACMNAARRDHEMVTLKDVQDATNTAALGRSRDSAFMNDTDRELTAYHEAGHATVGLLLSRDSEDKTVRPNFITVIPRGAAGGMTRLTNSESNYMRKSTARAFLAVAMGGRAAEMQRFGDEHYTSGAHGDLNAATSLATEMVLKFGMSDEQRLIAMDDRAIQMSQGKHDPLIQKEIERGLAKAKELLASDEGQRLMKAIAEELLVKETLHEAEIEQIERMLDVKTEAA